MATDGKHVTDVEVAETIRGSLPGQDLARLNSLQVLVYACYSGGFIDDLIGLGGVVSVATSSKHTETTRNGFGRFWMQAQLDESNRFVESKKTFEEADRLEGPRLAGTYQYGSTGAAADRTVPGAGHFGADGKLVSAKKLKIVLWTGDEVYSPRDRQRFELFSDWTQIQAVDELADVTGVEVEIAIFYDHLDAGLWRWDKAGGRFEELTEEQFAALPEAEQSKVVRVNGKGTEKNLVDTLKAYAAAADPETQIFVLLSSHGQVKAKPKKFPGDPTIPPGGFLDDTVEIHSEVAAEAANPALHMESSGIGDLSNVLLFDGAPAGAFLPDRDAGATTTLSLDPPLAAGEHELLLSCEQETPCTFDNLGVLQDVAPCPTRFACVRALIGPEGGVLHEQPPLDQERPVQAVLGGSVALLTIPAGALSHAMPVALCRALASDGTETTAGAVADRHLRRRGLSPLELQRVLLPAGLRLAAPARLRIDYAEGQLPGVPRESLEPVGWEEGSALYSTRHVEVVDHDPVARRLEMEVSRLGRVLVARRSATAPEGPLVTLLLDRDHYRIGETASVGVALVHRGGEPELVDLLIGAILPGGRRVVFATPDGSRHLRTLSDPSEYVPWIRRLRLEPGSELIERTLAEVEVVAGMPAGRYRAFAVLARSGALADGSIDDGDLLSLDRVDVERVSP